MSTEQNPDYEVKAGFEKIESFQVAGLSIVTNNETGAQDINALWERLFEDEIGQKLEEVRENDFIYAVYSNYEGDHTQPYRFTLGYKLAADQTAPADFYTVTTQSDDYAMLAAAGEQPKALIEAWTSIWQSDLDRNFATDFEIYGPRFFEEGVHEILICVGVKA